MGKADFPACFAFLVPVHSRLPQRPTLSGKVPGLYVVHQMLEGNRASSKEKTMWPPDGSPGRAVGPESRPEPQGSIGEEETG